MVKRISTIITGYAACPDKLAEFAARMSLVVVFNQPFYPLYLHAIVGTAAWPAWLTLLSTPLFVAVPALARRNSLAGRSLLPIVGVANTVLSTKLFGAASGVELFLIPCALLAAVLFRPQERLRTLPVLALPFLAYLFADPWLGSPMMLASDAQLQRIFAVNATSVGALNALAGLLLAGQMSALEAVSNPSSRPIPN